MEMDQFCIICGKGADKEVLCQVGKMKNRENQKDNPINSLITLARKCDSDELIAKLTSNKENNILTYNHQSCRTNLRNAARKRKSSDETPTRSSKRVCGNPFDFKKLCFYCEHPCEFDDRHPDRFKEYCEVETIDTDIFKETLHICKSRSDDYAMNIQRRLLSVVDLVAPEARYHIACRTAFEVPSDRKTPGRPVSTTKNELFEKACTDFLQDDVELYTVSQVDVFPWR